jgi:hypothetical protein
MYGKGFEPRKYLLAEKIKLAHMKMLVYFDQPWNDSTKQDKTVGTIWGILFFIFARCVYFI